VTPHGLPGRLISPADSWRRQGTPAVDAAVAIAFVALPLGLISGRPEMAVIAAPLLVAAVIALAASEAPQVGVGLSVTAERVLEGHESSMSIHLVSATTATVVVDYTVSDPTGVHHYRAGAAVEPGLHKEMVVDLDSHRWGAREVTVTAVTVDQVMGLVRHRQHLAGSLRQRVLPTSETLSRILPPRRTRPTSGNLPSKALGPGLEFAETRPYRVGDDHRWINWRSSARRGELWVNQYHVERSADVVLFIDAFRDVPMTNTDSESSTVLSVRLADALARSYLREHARVGAVSFGANVRWLRLGMGRRQAFQIVETLIDAEATLRSRRIRSSALPPRQIPRESLVIVISPLLDHRVLTAIAYLRARDHEVVVIDMGTEFDIAPADESAGLDARLLALGRRDARTRLATIGVPVAAWDPTHPIDTAFAVLQRWRGRSAAGR
jgi:uncharacterized protein (DUF58 family)